jgi:hypothetical protein
MKEGSSMPLNENAHWTSIGSGSAKCDAHRPGGPFAGCPSWCTDHDHAGDPQSEAHAATLEIGDELFVSICQHVRDPEPLPELYVDLQAEGTGVNLRRLATALLDTAEHYEAVIREELSAHTDVQGARRSNA